MGDAFVARIVWAFSCLQDLIAADYALGYELEPNGPDPERRPFSMDDTIALLQAMTVEDPMEVFRDVPSRLGPPHTPNHAT